VYTGYVYRRLVLYAEVGFNAIMHYVHYREPTLVARSPILLSLQHRYKQRGYYQYRAIPIYRKVLQHLREICRMNAL